MSVGNGSDRYKHLRLRLKGDGMLQRKFHYMMRTLDSDWPWRPGGFTNSECAICGGRFYKSPLVSARDIKAAGRQLGLRKVVVEYFEHEEKCKAKGDIWKKPDNASGGNTPTPAIASASGNSAGNVPSPLPATSTVVRALLPPQPSAPSATGSSLRFGGPINPPLRSVESPIGGDGIPWGDGGVA